MGYNLWLGEEADLKEYYSRRMGSRSLGGQIMLGDSGDEESLSFVIDGVRKTELTLDEIDSFICGFTDLDDLRRHLALFDEWSDVASQKGRLIIASRYENIDKYQVVYNNRFLQRCAMVIRNKRKNNEPEYLDQTTEMRNYAERFVEYVLNPEAKKSLLESKLLHPIVKQNINAYAINKVTGNKAGMEESFDRLFKNLMNYKTLRGTVIWESKYLEEKDMPFTDDMDPELVSVYRQMLDDENARRRPLKSDLLTHIDSMRDEDNNIDFDQVYGQYDTDDIYSRNRSDLQVLGFLPKDNSDDVKAPRK